MSENSTLIRSNVFHNAVDKMRRSIEKDNHETTNVRSSSESLETVEVFAFKEMVNNGGGTSGIQHGEMHS